MVPTEEDATVAHAYSAAAIASDLDVVLKDLRNGIGQEQQVRSPEQLVPRK